ncbi:N-acetyltransferase ESCO2 [Xyrichtys novacula]|uniref:N-acetyltransferase ESCO2 n=1 Tax=Xyrichtys novacula TaxID=13765 RepID=A0AAV1H004_XYRNO|nr:N-acetyltransferase ESCO2 [Xyrichtys novacula]
MMPISTRKRKLPSVDSDSQPSKEGVSECISPVKRRSPRKRPVSHLDKENCPSPQKSPRRPAGSPAKSPRKSPFKRSVVTSSFYGKQKPVYLTPLERKAIKESLPPPPHPPAPVASPPSQEKKKRKKGVKGGSEQRKTTAGSSKAGKMGVKSVTTSAKTIKLPKPSSSIPAKPPATTTATITTSTSAPASSTKHTEAKKSITITFSSLKPKPKIFVGAAFFGTGKKPTSMYKKSAPKSSNRPAVVPVRNKAVPPQMKSEKPKQQEPTATVSQQQKHPEETEVQPTKIGQNHQNTKQRSKFDPTDWMDEQPETLQPSSFKSQTGKLKLRELSVVLTQMPLPTSRDSPSSTQVAESSEPVLDLSEITPENGDASPPKESASVYPIFGSSSKRSLRAPVSCSTPSGTAASLQTTSSVRERPVRRRKEKQGEDQLIIDAGQKQFGATTCSSCGMVYSADNPEDNFQHIQFHQSFLDSIKFVGWKKERVVAEFWDGKILLVMPDDPKYAVKKAEDVRRVADSELGFQQVTLSRPTQAKTYLFVNTERMVVGCLVAEPIHQVELGEKNRYCIIPQYFIW